MYEPVLDTAELVALLTVFCSGKRSEERREGSEWEEGLRNTCSARHARGCIEAVPEP